jgi:hypothetical protein
MLNDCSRPRACRLEFKNNDSPADNRASSTTGLREGRPVRKVQRFPPVPARRYPAMPARDAAQAVRYRQTSQGSACRLLSDHLHLRFRSNLASTSTSRGVVQQSRWLVWLLIDRLPGAGGA